MPGQVDVGPFDVLGFYVEGVYPLLMSRDPLFVRFREDMVDARQYVRPFEQGFEQFDLGAFDIDLEYADVFIETLEIADEVYLPDLNGILLGDI